MFERFTERARKVVVLAQGEAGLLRHNYIGTEHLLLGLLREDEGLAARILSDLGVTVEEARERIVSIVGYGSEGPGLQAPFTPRSKKVLELALREAMHLEHNYIGTEHILLGLVRESEGVAARVLSDLGIDPDTVRREVLRRLGEAPGSDPFDLAEGDAPPEFAGNQMLFRGRVESLKVGVRAGNRTWTVLVDLDYTYTVEGTEDAPGALDHDGLLTAVAGAVEGLVDIQPVEACIQEAGKRVLEQFPAVREVTISATRERALEGRAASSITVSRTFRR